MARSEAFTVEVVMARRPTPVQETILRLLLDGRPTHKEVMIGAVYGGRADGGPLNVDNTIKQHVCLLRKNLREGFEIVNESWHGEYILRRKKGVTETYSFRASLVFMAEVEAGSTEEAVATLTENLKESGLALPDGTPMVATMFALQLGEAASGIGVRLWAKVEDAGVDVPRTYVVASSYKKARQCAEAGGLRPDRWAWVHQPEQLEGLVEGRLWVYGDASTLDTFEGIRLKAHEMGLDVEYK